MMTITKDTQIEDLMDSFSSVLDADNMMKLDGVLRQLANAMLQKNWRFLKELLSHGRGFNDNSKRAFCEGLGKTEILTMKAIDDYIAICCDVSVPFMKATLNYEHALEQLKAAESEVLEFSDGAESIEFIEQHIKDGMDSVKTVNRKTYLLSTETGKGYYLPRRAIIEYAKLSLKVRSLTDELVYEKKKIAKSKKQNVIISAMRDLRNASSLFEWLDNVINEGFNQFQSVSGVTYLCNVSGQGYPLRHEHLIDYAKAECILNG